MMEYANVKFLALGGGGGKIVKGLTETGVVPGKDVVVADTDNRALADMDGIRVIQMGESWTAGDGCGGDRALGEKAAGESADRLEEVVQEAGILFVVVALGGGAGSGAARVVAQKAKETNTTTMFMVTLPFSFEGNWRRNIAAESLEPLRRSVDAVITIPNDLLFTTLAADTPVREAFSLADTMLAESLASLARIAVTDGLISADFAAFRNLLKENTATSLLGVGRGTGENRSEKALESLLTCPLLGGAERMKQADAAVVSLLGGSDVNVGEMKSCLSSVQEYLPPDIRLVVGAYTMDDLEELQITALLCHYENPDEKEKAAAAKDRKAARDNTPAGGKEKSGGNTSGRPQQAELPLQEQSLGIFSGSTPSLLKGENLDIPTFQRKGVRIELEE
mgnify:CR=1 FL=1